MSRELLHISVSLYKFSVLHWIVHEYKPISLSINTITHKHTFLFKKSRSIPNLQQKCFRRLGKETISFAMSVRLSVRLSIRVKLGSD